MARDRGGASTSAVDETADETGEARRRRLRDEDMLVARAKAIREKIKALDARANGYGRSEGVGATVLLPSHARKWLVFTLKCCVRRPCELSQLRTHG